MNSEDIKAELPERLRRYPLPKIPEHYSKTDQVILAYNAAAQLERTELWRRLEGERPSEYYLQTLSITGNCAMWWRMHGAGFTSNLDDAGKYSREDAMNITKLRPGQDIAWEVAKIDAIAIRHVQSLPAYSGIVNFGAPR